MYDEYGCGCIVSPVQGRVRVCHGHRNVVEYNGRNWIVIRSQPAGKIVRSFPANGIMPSDWK